RGDWVIAPLLKSSSLTVAIELVISSLRWVPYPTTTTSSRAVRSSLITTSITLLPPTSTVRDWKPRNENTKVDPSATDNESTRSKSVPVPRVVPNTDAVTPGKASPLASVTVPATVIWSSSRITGASERFFTLTSMLWLICRKERLLCPEASFNSPSTVPCFVVKAKEADRSIFLLSKEKTKGVCACTSLKNWSTVSFSSESFIVTFSIFLYCPLAWIGKPKLRNSSCRTNPYRAYLDNI